MAAKNDPSAEDAWRTVHPAEPESISVASTIHGVSKSHNKIFLADLSPQVAAKLKHLDLDGDGAIDVGEISAQNDSFLSIIKTMKNQRYVIALMVFMWVVQILAVFAVSFGASNLSNPSFIGESGQLISKTTGKSIQTSSTDTCVVDGNLVTRAFDGSCPTDGSATLKTTPSFVASELTSELDDEYFKTVQSVNFASDSGNLLHLNVIGFLRNATDPDRSVTLFVYGGHVVVGMDTLYFKDTTSEMIFERAGIQHSMNTTYGTTRRLSAVTSGATVISTVKSPTRGAPTPRPTPIPSRSPTTKPTVKPTTAKPTTWVGDTAITSKNYRFITNNCVEQYGNRNPCTNCGSEKYCKCSVPGSAKSAVCTACPSTGTAGSSQVSSYCPGDGAIYETNYLPTARPTFKPTPRPTAPTPKPTVRPLYKSGQTYTCTAIQVMGTGIVTLNVAPDIAHVQLWANANWVSDDPIWPFNVTIEIGQDFSAGIYYQNNWVCAFTGVSNIKGPTRSPTTQPTFLPPTLEPTANLALVTQGYTRLSNDCWGTDEMSKYQVKDCGPGFFYACSESDTTWPICEACPAQSPNALTKFVCPGDGNLYMRNTNPTFKPTSTPPPTMKVQSESFEFFKSTQNTGSPLNREVKGVIPSLADFYTISFDIMPLKSASIRSNIIRLTNSGNLFPDDPIPPPAEKTFNFPSVFFCSDRGYTYEPAVLSNVNGCDERRIYVLYSNTQFVSTYITSTVALKLNEWSTVTIQVDMTDIKNSHMYLSIQGATSFPTTSAKLKAVSNFNGANFQKTQQKVLVLASDPWATGDSDSMLRNMYVTFRAPFSAMPTPNPTAVPPPPTSPIRPACFKLLPVSFVCLAMQIKSEIKLQWWPDCNGFLKQDGEVMSANALPNPSSLKDTSGEYHTWSLSTRSDGKASDVCKFRYIPEP